MTTEDGMEERGGERRGGRRESGRHQMKGQDDEEQSRAVGVVVARTKAPGTYGRRDPAADIR